MRAMRPLLFLMILLLTLALSGRDPFAQRAGLAERVGHHDPSRYRAGRSHGSVGDMNCMTLLPGTALRPTCISCTAARSRPAAASATTSTTLPKRCSSSSTAKRSSPSTAARRC